jgi:peptidoglycan/LPS O-acetylase OafA/YrhL
MKYRSEIDGLRAFAVLPVMLFHSGFQTFGGGFVGVDVFFVISGYLITTIIATELGQEQFSIVNFYERRARRILPALFAVLLVTLPVTWLVMMPDDLKKFADSLFAVSIFLSNHLFLNESGYFDTAAELKPLLHTWSLAVEEQFYILFPPLLMLLWRRNFRLKAIALGLLIFISLAWSQWAAYAKPASAFYLLPSRCWELLLGGCVALSLHRKRSDSTDQWWQVCLGWSGLFLIAGSIFAYSKATPFPGLHALIPAAGAVLIIVYANGKNSVGQFLGHPIFSSMGLISYSAYLWHQPIFALSRHWSMTEPDRFTFLMLIAITLLLAYLGWRFIEKPFRDRRLFSRRFIFGFSGLGIVFFSMIACAIHFEWFKKTVMLPSEVENQFANHHLRTSCDDGSGDSTGNIPFCLLGDTRKQSPEFAVFGDSHSDAFNPAFDRAAKAAGVSYVHHGLGGCAPLLGADVIKGNWAKGVCESIAEKQYEFVK